MYPNRRPMVKRASAVNSVNDAWKATHDAYSQLLKVQDFFLYGYTYDEIRQDSAVSRAEDEVQEAISAVVSALDAVERLNRYA